MDDNSDINDPEYLPEDDEEDTTNHMSDLSDEDHTENHVNMDRLPLIPTDFTSITEALQNFAIVFESRYGGLHPRFQMNSLHESLDEAFGSVANKIPIMEQRPIAIYLHHDDAIGCNIFAQTVLCSDAISSLLSGQFVLWPWDVTQADNRVKLYEWLVASNLVQVKDVEKGTTKDEHPLLILLVKDRGNYNVTEIIRGTDLTDQAMEKLINCLDAFQQIKNREAAVEQQRLERQAIQREQVDEYERSKAIDRAKAQERKRLESEKAEQEEEERRREEQKPVEPEVKAPDLGDWKSHATAASSSESTPITVVLRLPSGERQVLELNSGCKLVAIFAFIQSSGLNPLDYKLMLSFPRREYTFAQASSTLGDLQFQHQETVHVTDF